MNVIDFNSKLEMTRTNPAHFGNAPLSGITRNEHSETSGRKKGVFETYLLDAVNTVNNSQLEVGNVQQQLITDPDSVDIHDVTTAMAKAQMSLSLAQTVIDRLLTGWSEIQTTR